MPWEALLAPKLNVLPSVDACVDMNDIPPAVAGGALVRVATIMVELALTPPVKEVLALLDGAGAALNVKLPPGTVEGAGAALNVKPPPETVEGAGVPPNVKPLPATVEGAGVPPNENLLSGFALLVNV